MEKIAVIILNYNSVADCKKCIPMLQLQNGVSPEFFIVDSASNEKEVKELKEYCYQQSLNFYESKENLGYNRGNNIGLRAAAKKGYKYALVCNPDMEFPKRDFLSKLVKDFKIDKEIVAVGGYIKGLDGKPQSPMKADGNWSESFNWIRDIWYAKTGKPISYLDNPESSHICSKLMGSCLLVDLDFIQRIGFFDEKVFLYCEEAILAKVISNDGKKAYYDASAIAIHAHSKSKKGNSASHLKFWRKSRLYFYSKYSGYNSWGKLISKISTIIYISAISIAKRLRK
mgnify:CR=1 FL=1